MTAVYNLTGGSPWGFRLVGGKDFRTSLSVSRVTPGGKAEQAGVKSGMVLVEINGNNTKGMTHLEAQNEVKTARSSLTLVIEDAANANSSRSSAPDYATEKPKSAPLQVPKSPAKTSYTPRAAPVSSAVRAAPVSAPVRAAPLSAPVEEPLPPPPPPSMLAPQVMQSTGSDPLCEGCGKVILGPYLSHKGKNWHIDEFVCAASNCRKPLQNIGFIEEDGSRYCKDCYEKHFAHTCGKCHKKIVGEVMHALNQTWHMTCFVCVACNQAFTDGVFQMQNDQPYCINDYNRLFSQICQGCNFSIEAGDRYLEALNAHWHETCFQCAVCHSDLKNAGFFSAGGKPVCSNHRNARVA